MVQGSRRRFLRVSDWHDFLVEVQQTKQDINLYALRQQCYRDIEVLRQRALLVYAVEFPTASIPLQTPFQPPIFIDLDDVDGFIDLAESIDDGKAVDVLIHSPGGSPEATERIVSLLRSNFDDIAFLIPHSAYSAATMLALAGNRIVLHPSASLGPIDPQINGIPARALRRGFDKAREALREQGPEALPAYVPLIEKYTLELLEICEDYEYLSKELVSQWLRKYMFEDNADPEKIEEIVTFFANYDSHRTHSRPLTYDKIQHLGLNIDVAAGDLRGLLREAHILLSGFFQVTPFVKVFENSSGLSWGRQFQIVAQPPTQARKPA